MSHSETGTPLATAAAATVKAWLQRSGSSLPAVTLMTSREWAVRSGMAETLTRRAAGRRGRPARTLRAMHGMLSAAIVIGVFAVAAAACLYLAVRVLAAGGRRGDPS